MNPDLLKRTLADHASTVPAGHPDLAALHGRVEVARRRRRRLGAAAGVAVASVVAVVAAAVLQSADPATAPAPATDPAEGDNLPLRPDPVEVTPPPDARENARPMRTTDWFANKPGQT